MKKQNSNERPEVYALRQNGGDWQISRRDFLKAAGIGAAALGAGLNSGCSKQNNTWNGKTESLDILCPQTPSHKKLIRQLLVSLDGKYLVSNDTNDVKCWDFNTTALLQTYNAHSEQIVLGQIGGKESVIKHSADPSSGKGRFFTCYPLPEERKIADDLNARTAYLFKSFAVDSAENIYTVNDAGIHVLTKESAYEQDEILFAFRDPEKNPSCTLFANDKKVFIRLNEGFGILDLVSKEFSQFEIGCTSYAVCRDGTKALIFSGFEYRLVSLENGETLWSQTVTDIRDGDGTELFVSRRVSGGSYVNCKTAVTPDGSAGILLGEKAVCLISMTDGSLIRHKPVTGDPDAGVGCLAIARDGSKAAVSLSNTILFLSLPDLEIIGCPIDLSEVKDNVSGIEVSVKDPVTGKNIQYTMPCGAAIPEGAVCTCNCVSGRSGCACNSHGKSNGNGRSNGNSGHYWHPN